MKAKRGDLAALDKLIEEIIVDAYGDDEQLWAFRQTMEDEISFPCDGSVVGELVTVLSIDYDGNERRGLTATCQRADGSRYIVSAADVELLKQSKGYRYIACYRKWQGLDPFPYQSAAARSKPQFKKNKEISFDQNDGVELIVRSVKQTSARCRFLKGGQDVTLRTASNRKMIPGEIVTVKPEKMWDYAGHRYLSGKIESTRLDIAALGLVPLELKSVGIWDPKEHYWGEEDGPVEAWTKPIIARGKRPSFEMEQVLPGVDPDHDSDPICNAVELKNAGDHRAASNILMALCEQDLRCLDAHAHLGNLWFDHAPEKAMRHYEVGLRIGELSLGSGFDGLLEWGFIDNRPFLRCMHGYGLTLWRLGRFKQAQQVINRMLWLNPSDNQGVRFDIERVTAKLAWEEDY